MLAGEDGALRLKALCCLEKRGGSGACAGGEGEVGRRPWVARYSGSLQGSGGVVDTGTWVTIFPVNAQRPKFVLGEVTVSSGWTATLPSDRPRLAKPQSRGHPPVGLHAAPEGRAPPVFPLLAPHSRFRSSCATPSPPAPHLPSPPLPSSAHDLASCPLPRLAASLCYSGWLASPSRAAFLGHRGPFQDVFSPIFCLSL